jgi:hypothetical protein
MRPMPSNRWMSAAKGIPVFFLIICLTVVSTGCQTVPPPATLETITASGTHPEVALTLAVLPVAGLMYAAGWRPPKGPPILETGTDSEIAAAGVAEAHADITKGRPRICWAGTIAVWPMGVSYEQLHLVKGLRKVPLPSGCEHPLAQRAKIYAEAYNEVILQHLLDR